LSLESGTNIKLTV